MTLSNTDPRDAYRDRILRLLIEQMENNTATSEGINGIKLQMKANGYSDEDIGGAALRARQDLAQIKKDRKPTDKRAKQETIEQIAASLSPFAGLPLVDAALNAARQTPIELAVTRAKVS